MTVALPIPPVVDLPAAALPLWVVGDVHLCLEDMAVMDRFLAWLETLEGRGGTLILLGDVFDLWVARRQQEDALPRHVLGRIQRLIDAGTKVAYMPGNRDLAFRGADGVELEVLTDPVRMQVGERTVVFTHGDGKRWLGDGVRNLSMRETGKKSQTSMDIDYAEALRWMEHYEADMLVAGHVHTGLHHRHPGPPEREIFVLKDWEHGGSVITFEGDSAIHAAP